jgi:hypothetical protein
MRFVVAHFNCLLLITRFWVERRDLGRLQIHPRSHEREN